METIYAGVIPFKDGSSETWKKGLLDLYGDSKRNIKILLKFLKVLGILGHFEFGLNSPRFT